MAASKGADPFGAMWDADQRWERGSLTTREALGRLITDVAAPLVDSAACTLEVGGGSAWEPLRTDAGPAALWTDLRPSEAAALMDLVRVAVESAEERCVAAIEDELRRAEVAFAESHPDARRAA